LRPAITWFDSDEHAKAGQIEIASVAAMTRARSAKSFLIAAEIMACAVAWSLAFASTAHLFARRAVDVRLNRLSRY